MKYESKTFDVPVGSDAYREGWERIFGKKEIITTGGVGKPHLEDCKCGCGSLRPVFVPERPVLCGCGAPLMKDGWCHECGGYRG